MRGANVAFNFLERRDHGMYPGLDLLPAGGPISRIPLPLDDDPVVAVCSFVAVATQDSDDSERESILQDSDDSERESILQDSDDSERESIVPPRCFESPKVSISLGDGAGRRAGRRMSGRLTAVA